MPSIMSGRGVGRRTVANLALAKSLATVSNASESDEQILARITERFTVMEEMTYATAVGLNRALIISGPAGLGKSHGVHKVVDELGDDIKFTVIKGFVRPTGLYKTLYEHREKGQVVIFDDADSIFFDDVSLNLLKSACDSTSVRRLSWLAETRMEDDEGERLPRHFVFEGSVVFITNYDFDRMIAGGHRLAPHFEAMISRSHYLDLAIKTRRDYLIRIGQVVEHGMLDDSGLTREQQKEVVNYIRQHADRLREISLRMVVKIANLLRMNPKRWENIARVTCLKNIG